MEKKQASKAREIAIKEILTQHASTSGDSTKILNEMGIYPKFRFGCVVRFAFDDTPCIKNGSLKDALVQSYDNLCKETNTPRIYDWLVGAI